MPKATILAIALVCGSGAFLWTLYTGGARYTQARDSAANAALSARRGMTNMVADFPRPRTRAELEKVAAEDPGNFNYLFDLGRFCEAQGDSAAATKYWTATFALASKTLEADPSNLRAGFLAAWSSERLGHQAEAQARFRAIVDAYEARLQNGARDPRTYLQRIGWCRAKLGDAESARDAWTRALKMLQDRPVDSLGPEETYDMGCLLILTGKSDEGLAALDLAVRRGFRDGEWARADEDLESLRDDPRMKAIFQRMDRRRPAKKDGV